MTYELIAFTLILAAAIAGLALKDVRYYFACLAVSAVMLVLLIAHAVR